MKHRKQTEAEISGKLIKFKHSSAASVLCPASNTIRSQRSGKFDNVRMTFKEDCLEFSWTEKYNHVFIQAGYGPDYITCQTELAGSMFNFASTCAWLEDGSLEVWIRPLEHAQVRKFNFTFKGSRVKMKSTAEKGLFDMAIFDLDFKGRKTGKIMRALTQIGAFFAEPVLDPDLKGKFVEPMYR
jgi:hypothetical protein